MIVSVPTIAPVIGIAGNKPPVSDTFEKLWQAIVEAHVPVLPGSASDAVGPQPASFNGDGVLPTAVTMLFQKGEPLPSALAAERPTGQPSSVPMPSDGDGLSALQDAITAMTGRIDAPAPLKSDPQPIRITVAIAQEPSLQGVDVLRSKPGDQLTSAVMPSSTPASMVAGVDVPDPRQREVSAQDATVSQSHPGNMPDASQDLLIPNNAQSRPADRQIVVLPAAPALSEQGIISKTEVDEELAKPALPIKALQSDTSLLQVPTAPDRAAEQPIVADRASAHPETLPVTPSELPGLAPTAERTPESAKLSVKREKKVSDTGARHQEAEAEARVQPASNPVQPEGTTAAMRDGCSQGIGLLVLQQQSGIALDRKSSSPNIPEDPNIALASILGTPASADVRRPQIASLIVPDSRKGSGEPRQDVGAGELPTKNGPVIFSLDRAIAPHAPARALVEATSSQLMPHDQVPTHHLDLASDGAWLDQLSRDIATAASTDGHLRFALAPEHLGRLEVQMQAGNDGTAIRLTTESHEAHRIISEAQPQLVSEARAQGLRISEARVDLQSANSGGSAGHQSFGNQNSGGRPQPHRLTSPAEATSQAEASQAEISASDALYA